MEIKELLKGVDCTCGKHHSCDIDFIAIERGAIGHLTGLCANDKCILLVCDENTYAAAGAQTETALAGLNVKKVTFPGNVVLIPNEDAVPRSVKIWKAWTRSSASAPVSFRIFASMFPTRAESPTMWSLPLLPWTATPPPALP